MPSKLWVLSFESCTSFKIIILLPNFIRIVQFLDLQDHDQYEEINQFHVNVTHFKLHNDLDKKKQHNVKAFFNLPAIDIRWNCLVLHGTSATKPSFNHSKFTILKILTETLVKIYLQIWPRRKIYSVTQKLNPKTNKSTKNVWVKKTSNNLHTQR